MARCLQRHRRLLVVCLLPIVGTRSQAQGLRPARPFIRCVAEPFRARRGSASPGALGLRCSPAGAPEGVPAKGRPRGVEKGGTSRSFGMTDPLSRYLEDMLETARRRQRLFGEVGDLVVPCARPAELMPHSRHERKRIRTANRNPEIRVAGELAVGSHRLTAAISPRARSASPARLRRPEPPAREGAHAPLRRPAGRPGVARARRPGPSTPHE